MPWHVFLSPRHARGKLVRVTDIRPIIANDSYLLLTYGVSAFYVQLEERV